MYPIVVELYHLMGTRNVEDMNSKIPTSYNPVELINSTEWRHGLPEFLEPSFPPIDRVFLRFIGGAVEFYRQLPDHDDRMMIIGNNKTQE